MAEAVTSTPDVQTPGTEVAAQGAVEEPNELVAPPSSLTEPSRSAAYPWRFLLAYGALTLVAGAACVAFILLLGRSDSDGDSAWSRWSPTASSTLAQAREIADHVAPRYRLTTGRQLVAVQAQPPTIQNVELGGIVVTQMSASGDPAGDFTVVPANESIIYVLCGGGENCSIQEGEPSEERGLLLRRQALELALYTFRYVDDVKSVVAFLPPLPKATTNRAVFLREAQLERELDRPLLETLPDTSTLTPSDIRPAERRTVDRLTGRSWFRSEFQQAPNGSPVLVLNDPAAEEAAAAAP